MERYPGDLIAGPAGDPRPSEEVPPEGTISYRRDSGSIMHSGTPRRMSSGLFEFPVHGSCPRCHHLHKASLVKVRMSRGHKAHVRCERCRQKWFALGGQSETCLSLASGRSVDLNPAEVNFRETLYQMVLSLSAVGSPRLPSVSEQGKTDTVRPDLHVADYDIQNDEPISSTKTCEEDATVQSSSKNQMEKKTIHKKAKRTQALVCRMKRMANNRHLRRLLHLVRNRDSQKVSEKGLGKRPVPYETAATIDHIAQPDPIDSTPKPKHVASPDMSKRTPSKDRTRKEGVSAAEKRFTANLGTLKDMSAEDRETWMRKEIDRFKISTMLSQSLPSEAILRRHSDPHDPLAFSDYTEPLHDHPSSLSLATARLSQATTVNNHPGIQVPLSQVLHRETRPLSLHAGVGPGVRLRRHLDSERGVARSSGSHTLVGSSHGLEGNFNTPPLPTSVPTNSSIPASLLHGIPSEQQPPTPVAEEGSDSSSTLSPNRDRTTERNHLHRDSV